jgi:2'-5' RNA ligase
MIKLGVFYCVDGDLKKNVESIKSFFKTKSNESKYLNHLVHSTFYVFEIESKKINDVIEKFQSLQKFLSPVSSKINKWRVFENDILTNLNTLCLEIELSKDLFNLQMNIVNSLLEFHLKKTNTDFEGLLKESYNQYGYPFVGEHWIPHITIGSLDIEKKKITEFSEEMINFPRTIKINNLGLFKIESDSHSLIKRIEF